MKVLVFHIGAQRYGLDLAEGRLVDNVERGVLEPALSKTKMIQVR